LKLTEELNPSSESEDSECISDDSGAQSDKENRDFSRGITDEDLSTSILYKLVKAAKCTGLPRLKGSSDLRERRKYFNAWQSDLAIVTSTVTVTKELFTEWPQKIGDLPNYANNALFNLVSSRCESAPKAHIRHCHGNGTQAIIELQRHYAQITTEIIDSAMSRYQQLRQRNNETATSYIQRFDTMVDECRQLGEDFDTDKLLSRFMDGLNTNSDVYKARIESLIAQKNMSQLNSSLNPITLPYVQSQLLSIDEKRGLTTPQDTNTKKYKAGSSYAMPATANIKNTRTNTQQKHPQRNVKCGYKYCGKPGHTTEECRKRKRDEEYKAKSNKRTNTTKDKSNIRCYKCNTKGHYANECPNQNKNTQQAHSATVDTIISRSSNTTQQPKTSMPSNSIEELIMMAGSCGKRQ
jgi:hypothetical protein